MLGMFNVKHSSWQAWLSATGSGRHEKFRPEILYAKDELGQSVISGKRDSLAIHIQVLPKKSSTSTRQAVAEFSKIPIGEAGCCESRMAQRILH